MYDLGIVLGAQIVFNETLKIWVPSRHLMLRIGGAAAAYHQGLISYLVLTGGHNVGVRYNEKEIFQRPDFALEAFTRAQDFPSEASVMKRILHVAFRVPNEHMFQESLSATTAENRNFLEVILKRTPTFDALTGIALITQLYHMPDALKAFSSDTIEPLFIEDLLAGGDLHNEVIAYYRDRFERTKNPFPDVEYLAECMNTGQSVATLMPTA